MPRKKLDPASLQIVNAIGSLRSSFLEHSDYARKSFDTIVTSLDKLHQLFNSSKLFIKVNAKSAIDFYKKAPGLLKDMSESLKGGMGTSPVLEQSSALMADLVNQINNLGISIMGLGDDLNEMAPAREEMVDIMQAIMGASNLATGVSENVDFMNKSLEEAVSEFNDLTQGAKLNADAYLDITRQVREINNRLMRVRRNQEAVGEGMEEVNEEISEYGDKILSTMKSMLLMQGLDLLQTEGAKDAATTIAGLNDELLELKKSYGAANFDLNQWRRTAIDMAKDLNKMGAAADPAEMVDLFSMVRKLGIQGSKDIQMLAKQIKIVERGTNVTKEDAAALGETMVKKWGASADSLGKYTSALIAVQGVTGTTVEELVSKTTEMGDKFAFAMRRLGPEAKQAFMVDMAGAVAAFNSVGIKSTTLFENMAEAVADPAAAASKLKGVLVGVGMSAIDIQSALERGDPTPVLEGILKGAKELRGSQAIELKKLLADMGLADDEIVQLTQRSTDIRQAMITAQAAGMKDFMGNMAALRSNVEVETKKTSNFFADFGKKIKTWMADIGVSAINSFGINIIDLGKKVVPIIFILDKFGFSFLKLGENIGGAFMSLGRMTKITPALSKMTSGIGAATTGFQGMASSALASAGPILIWVAAITAAVAAIWALIKWGPDLWKWFGKKFPNAAKKTEDAVMGIVYFLNDLKKSAIQTFKTIIDDFKPMLPPIITALKEFGKVIMVSVVSALKIWFKFVKIVFKSNIASFKIMLTMMKPLAKLWWNLFVVQVKVMWKVWNLTFGNIFKLFSKLFNFIKKSDVLKKMVNDAKTNLENYVMGVKLFVNMAENWVTKIGGALSGLTTFFDSTVALFSKLSSYVSKFIGDIFSNFGAFVDLMKEKLGIFSELVVSAFLTPFKAIKDIIMFVLDKFGSLINVGSKAISIIGKFFKFGKKEESESGEAVYAMKEASSSMKKMSDSMSSLMAAQGIKVMAAPTRKAIEHNIGRELPAATGGVIGAVGGIKDAADIPIIQQAVAAKEGKVMKAEPLRKIFAEPAKTMIPSKAEVDVHQEDVVAAINNLTNIIKKGQLENKNQTRISRATTARPRSEKSDLVKGYSL